MRSVEEARSTWDGLREIVAARAGKDLRLAIAWRLLFVAYLGLAAVSLAIFRRGIDLHTADGRHLLAGGLANLGLIWAGLLSLPRLTVRENGGRGSLIWPVCMAFR